MQVKQCGNHVKMHPLTPHVKQHIKSFDTYKNASILACVAGGIATILTYYDEKKSQGHTKALQHAVLHGTFNACKEGAKYIAKAQINKAMLPTILKQQNSKSCLSIAKKCGGTIAQLSMQLMLQSANDIMKWQKGTITQRECLHTIRKNAGGIVGGFMVARGCALLGSVMLPGIGVLVGSVAGMYIGEYIGRKIAE